MKSSAMYMKNVTTLELFEDRCSGCGMCAIVCPHGVFEVGNGRAAVVDRDACMECSACMTNCPEEAIFVQTGVGCAQAVINSALGRSEVPHEMTEAEIHEIIDGFARYAKLAREAGLDGCEIHGAHGYLAQQSWSPWANRRTDKWGERTAFITELTRISLAF